MKSKVMAVAILLRGYLRYFKIIALLGLSDVFLDIGLWAIDKSNSLSIKVYEVIVYD